MAPSYKTVVPRNALKDTPLYLVPVAVAFPRWNQCALHQAVDIAGSLLKRGICKGDRAAIIPRNSEALVLLWFALAKLGAIVVPVNPELNLVKAGYKNVIPSVRR